MLCLLRKGLVAAAMLVVGAGMAHAQSGLTLSCSATIATPLTAGSSADLAFGAIPKGSTSTVSATSNDAAALFFSGDESDNITVTLPSSVSLQTTSGTGGSMSVVLDRAGMVAARTNTRSSAQSAPATSGSITLALSNDQQGDGTSGDGLGQLFLWIGGSITPAATQQRGLYSGTFTVTAAYSN